MEFDIENGVLKKYTEEDGITDVVIPDGVTSIGDSAFCECENLKSITIPDSVTFIERGAFCSCTSLESIKIPDSVTSINRATFTYCSSLESITLPDRLAYIGDSAFYNCESLTSITIPDRVDSISRSAFNNCKNLKSIIIKSKNSSIKISDFSLAGKLHFYDDTKNTIELMRYKFSKKNNILNELKDSVFKFAVALYLIKEYNDESANDYLKSAIESIARHYIDKNDAENITEILRLVYLTKQNIDSMIEYAIENKKPEMQVILTNYKNDNFGFENGLEKLML